MTDRTVRYRPFAGAEFDIVGSDADRGVLLSIEQRGGQYEHGIGQLLRRVLPAGGVAVDVGANIGVLTRLMAELAPRGRVYAFEPAAENFGYLRRNVGGLGHVDVRRAAVLDRDGPVNLEFNEAYPAGSFVGEHGELVDGVRLDSWADEVGLTRLDVLKIDVEGAEPSVLAGARELIRRCRPVTVVECNVQALRRVAGLTLAEFFDCFGALFDRVGVVEESGSTTTVSSLTDLELLLGHHGVVDLVGMPRGSGLAAVGERMRSRARLTLLGRAHRPTRPPERNFVVSPGVTLSVDDEVRGRAGEVLRVPVRVVNGGPWWLSSEFTYEPVHLSYRWADEAGSQLAGEGHRTRFSEPLAPAGRAILLMTLELPPQPGRYELTVTLVQECFAWLDQIDPTCALRLPVEVTRSG
ncbi:MAG: FkbM family methyltransferase [Actinomycetota bacterium]|nr:FkbM family methyltransferase [Actinomycetota bacterium]